MVPHYSLATFLPLNTLLIPTMSDYFPPSNVSVNQVTMLQFKDSEEKKEKEDQKMMFRVKDGKGYFGCLRSPMPTLSPTFPPGSSGSNVNLNKENQQDISTGKSLSPPARNVQSPHSSPSLETEDTMSSPDLLQPMTMCGKMKHESERINTSSERSPFSETSGYGNPVFNGRLNGSQSGPTPSQAILWYDPLSLYKL